MPAPLEFTGERFLPGVPGEIAYEHWHRYAFAQRFVGGLRVLDAACGEGYGTALLAKSAAAAIGLDVDPAAIAHARAAYAGRANLRYQSGSVAAIPLPDSSVDVVVSFETIEHLPADVQPLMVAEFARVLTPGGVLVISSPNRKRYSDEREYHNPFHVHELYRDELAGLLAAAFAQQRWFHQAPLVASAVWSDVRTGGVEAWASDGHDVAAMPTPDAMYFIVVATRTAAGATAEFPSLSTFADRNDSELKRIDQNAAETLRLDSLLRARDEALARQTDHLHHLEDLVGHRERLIVERDAALAARDARYAELADAHTALQHERLRQEAALAAQERLLAYRQSLRGWLRWPAMRFRLSWQRWIHP